MINYNIVKVDDVYKIVQIQYQREGHDDYWVQQSLPVNYDDEYLHGVAESAVEEAQTYWDLREATNEYVVEEPTGTLKSLVLADQPEHDPIYEKATLSWTETDTTKTKVWTINDLDEQQKAINIRMKRDSLLSETDSEALIDRSLSTELTNYRESLRNITDQETFPNSVIWPILPIG